MRKQVEFWHREYYSEPFPELCRRKVEEFFPVLVPRFAGKHPAWPQEKLEARALLHLLANADLLHRGVVRRLAERDPAELGYSTSLHARIEWVMYHDVQPGDQCANAREMLRALAAADLVAARRFAEAGAGPLTHGHADLVLLYNGLDAVLKQDPAYLETQLSTFVSRNKVQTYVACVYACLIGIAERDSRKVAAGLESLLKTSRRISQPNDELKEVSLETHGVYELCRWVSPELVAEFDVDHPLPWDGEYHAWLRTRDPSRPFYDLSGISPLLDEWIMRLPRDPFSG